MKLSSQQETLTCPDRFIAHKLRQRRLELKITQRRLARSLGISAQQLSKYENNMDRIPAGRLIKLKEILKVPLNFFYEEEEESPGISKEVLMTCSNEDDKVTIRVCVGEGLNSQIKLF